MTWRRLLTWDATPELAMGLDEALLERPDSRPTLRFYTWSPPALSLGYFQRWRDVPAAADAPAVVRRITGGGAIHHAAELTFSIAAPQDHPLYRGSVPASYARVHGRIAAVLNELGVRAGLRGEDVTLASDRADGGMCFHESTPLDLVWDGRKGVGSAQRRRGGRVLHHGSIKLDASALEPGVATLAAGGASIAPAALAELLSAALGEWVDEDPSPEELELARERGARYVDPDFVRRR